jgi:hypothetical protein
VIEGATKHQNTVYAMGVIARERNRPKVPPVDLNMEDRHWWLAGWNDSDIEIRGPETPAKKVRRGKP